MSYRYVHTGTRKQTLHGPWHGPATQDHTQTDTHSKCSKCAQQPAHTSERTRNAFALRFVRFPCMLHRPLCLMEVCADSMPHDATRWQTSRSPTHAAGAHTSLSRALRRGASRAGASRMCAPLPAPESWRPCSRHLASRRRRRRTLPSGRLSRRAARRACAVPAAHA